VIANVLAQLEERGLLLVQDAAFPNVCAIVAGETVRGSWWGHPAGKRIFRVLEELEEGADVVFVKLLSKKVTLVHRRLWPALLAVASARSEWQLRALSGEATDLLERVDRERTVRSSGKAAKDLEARLLVASRQVHGARGAHETELESWSAWAKRVGCAAPLASEEAGRAALEAASEVRGAPVKFPWPRRS
jgi:hypothetical protein